MVVVAIGLGRLEAYVSIAVIVGIHHAKAIAVKIHLVSMDMTLVAAVDLADIYRTVGEQDLAIQTDRVVHTQGLLNDFCNGSRLLTVHIPNIYLFKQDRQDLLIDLDL